MHFDSHYQNCKLISGIKSLVTKSDYERRISMQLKLKENGYELEQNKQNKPIFTQIMFSGNYLGCSLTARLVKLTKSKVILGVQLVNTDTLEIASKEDCKVHFTDIFDLKSKEERIAFKKFGFTAVYYEYTGRIVSIKPAFGYYYENFNYLVEISIKRVTESNLRLSPCVCKMG